MLTDSHPPAAVRTSLSSFFLTPSHPHLHPTGVRIQDPPLVCCIKCKRPRLREVFKDLAIRANPREPAGISRPALGKRLDGRVPGSKLETIKSGCSGPKS